jgi:hypothetical protein
MAYSLVMITWEVLSMQCSMRGVVVVMQGGRCVVAIGTVCSNRQKRRASLSRVLPFLCHSCLRLTFHRLTGCWWRCWPRLQRQGWECRFDWIVANDGNPALVDDSAIRLEHSLLDLRRTFDCMRRLEERMSVSPWHTEPSSRCMDCIRSTDKWAALA